MVGDFCESLRKTHLPLAATNYHIKFRGLNYSHWALCDCEKSAVCVVCEQYSKLCHLNIDDTLNILTIQLV